MPNDACPSAVPHILVYCRVSTEEQKLRKNPVATQKQVCIEDLERAFGKGRFTVEFFIDEGLSGTLGAKDDSDDGHYRPQYTRLLEQIKAGRGDYVQCQSLDRLGRNELDVFRLREVLVAHQVKLRTVGREYDLAAPDDSLLYAFHAAMDAHQPRVTAVKSRAGKIQRKRRGLVSCSRPAFGWRFERPGEYTDPRERTIAPVPEEGEVVRQIARLYLAGHGYQAIAKRLAEEGARSPGPRGWYASTIRYTLLNCVHAGLVRVQEGEYARGKHYAHRYYDREVFEQIQREVERRADVRSYSAQGKSFLVGTIRCGECAAPLSSKSGTRARYYRCTGSQMERRNPCEGVCRKAEHIEQAVIKVIRAYATSEAIRNPAAPKVAQILSRDEQGLDERIAKQEAQLAKLDESVRWLIEQAARNCDQRDNFDESLQRQREKISRAERELQRLRERQGDSDRRTRRWKEIREILLDFDAIWAEMDLAERRRAISILFEEMTLSAAKGGNLLRMKPFFGEVQEVAIAAMNRRDRPKHGVQALTHRECEVLHLLGQGMTVTEIAEHFGITRGAVHQHRYKIHWKLGVDSDEEAIRLSRELVTERLPYLELAGRRKHDPEPEQLTETQLKLLPDLANPELLYKDIAEKHGIAEGTLKAHVHQMARRLRAASGRKLVIDKARRLGLLPEN